MLLQNFPLKKYNTFGIEVYANYFSEFNFLNELEELITASDRRPTFILGGGSNILFTKNYKLSW